jgi:hypothetical protein
MTNSMEECFIGVLYPTPEEATKCLELRGMSRKGTRLNIAEHQFVCSMFKQYPQWFYNTGVRSNDPRLEKGYIWKR